MKARKQFHAMAPLTPGNKPRYPLDRRLGRKAVVKREISAQTEKRTHVLL